MWSLRASRLRIKTGGLKRQKIPKRKQSRSCRRISFYSKASKISEKISNCARRDAKALKSS